MTDLPAVSTPDTPIYSVDLRQAARDAYFDLKQSGWKLAVYCHRIATERSYLAYGFTSAAGWARADLPAIASNLAHYAAAGAFLLGLPEADRPDWVQFPVFNVLAGGKMLTQDPATLLATLKSGATHAQIRQVVAAALPDEHREHEYRTIHLRVSLPVYAQWERAIHRAGYEACKATPTPDDLVECIAAALVNEPLWKVPNGIPDEEWREFVHTGQVKCRECGSLDRTRLTFHHVIPRSHQGHESTQVPLCLDCHEKIQDHWREWLATQDLEEACPP